MILNVSDTDHHFYLTLAKNIKHIIDPPDSLIELAIRHNSENIKYLNIKDKNKWIFHVIKEDPYKIKYFKNPTKEAQLYALSFIKEEDYMSFIRDFIDNTCKEVLFQDTLFELKLKAWKKMNYHKVIRSRTKLVLE